MESVKGPKTVTVTALRRKGYVSLVTGRYREQKYSKSMLIPCQAAKKIFLWSEWALMINAVKIGRNSNFI